MRQNDPPGKLELAVYIGDKVTVHPLPLQGEVTLGRSAESDVPINDASVSREHAILQMGSGRDGALEIKDLGSANGTRVRAREEEKASGVTRTENLQDLSGKTMEVQVGALINLGSVRMVVRRCAVAPAQARGPLVLDPAMVALYEQAYQVAQSKLSVLVLGETGVGKELLAQAIHERSPRAAGPFLVINCAALVEGLVESELFGYMRNAFTGASRDTPGLFELASGGTVFLDEVGELALNIQAKLLRVLAEQKVCRLGSPIPRAVDVRILSATNRDLEAESERGAFRSDLFHRLNGITFTIPPLRDRVVEIEPLARTFLAHSAGQLGRARPPELSPKVIEALVRYGWLGNVRELRNAIDRAVTLCAEDTLALAHLPPRVLGGGPLSARAPARPAPPPPSQPDRAKELREQLDAHEKQQILDALEKFAWNQRKAAEHLGIGLRTLGTKLDKHGIHRPRKRYAHE